MIIKFLKADELKKEFVVSASFYQLKVAKKVFLCRNHAIIKMKGSIRKNTPDALIVMANPGSCEPDDFTINPPVMQNNLTNIPYVPVNTDPTQYQIMRLMKLMDWNEVSIINLSDVCSGNMSEFKQRLLHVENHSVNSHSIFSEERFIEREKYFNAVDKKVILAWGKDTSIKKLAITALEMIPKDKTLYGLKFPDQNWAYRHPNPMLKTRCITWLEDINRQLSSQHNIKAEKY